MSDSSDDESLIPEEKQFRRRFEQVAKAIQGSNISKLCNFVVRTAVGHKCCKRSV